MKGTQTSLNVMFVIGLVRLLIGIIVGAVAGYFRGWLDSFLMRITDLFITFPVTGARRGPRQVRSAAQHARSFCALCPRRDHLDDAGATGPR